MSPRFGFCTHTVGIGNIPEWIISGRPRRWRLCVVGVVLVMLMINYSMFVSDVTMGDMLGGLLQPLAFRDKSSDGNCFSRLALRAKQHGSNGTNLDEATRYLSNGTLHSPIHQMAEHIPGSTGTMSRFTMCHKPISGSSRDAPHHLCIRKSEGSRLGNEMFRYAAIYGLSRAKGMCPAVYSKTEVCTGFQLSAHIYSSPDFYVNFHVIHNVRDCAFDEKSVDFVNDRDVALSGYYQSYLYFKSYEDEIRKEFTFKDGIRQEAEKVICDALQKKFGERWDKYNKTQLYVGVHVRRGDIVNAVNYNVAPKIYFENAMEAFRVNYTDVIFIVCSDDIAWCEHSLTADDIVFVSGGSGLVDMDVLSMMDHTIMSVGTFGFWAAFLANGTTIYYKHPLSPGSKLRGMFSKDMTDYFYPHWIPME